MIRLDYAFHHLECAFGIVIGRPGALEAMDITSDGFWKSFGAFVIALPAYFFLWVISAMLTRAADPTTTMGGVMASSMVADVAGWILPVIVLAMIMGPLGYKHRFPHLIIARNWSVALMVYLLALTMVPLIFNLALGLATVISLVTLVIVVIAMVRVTRTALDTTYPVAVSFVVVEIVVMYTLAGLVYSAFSGSTAS